MTRSVMILVMLVVAGCDWIYYERETLTNGEFRGLRIGATKDDVLKQMQKMGVQSVRAAPASEFLITKRNIQDLDIVRKAEGIRISGPSGLAIDLFFRDGKVWHVRKSVPAKDNQWFSEGMDVQAVLAKLRDIVGSDPDKEIIPVVFYEGNGWTPIAESTELARQGLARHSAWMFQISSDKPAGAFVNLYFNDNALARIEYRSVLSACPASGLQ